MLRLKFSKILALIFTLILLFNALSMPVTAATSGQGQIDRDKEGKQDVSTDIDFFNDVNIDHSFAYQIRMATNYANRMAAQEVPLGGMTNGYAGSLNFSNIGVFFGYSSGEINTDNTFSSENSRYSVNSNSSITYSRNLFSSYTSPAGGTQIGPQSYADYGLMLGLMGFDAVGTESGDAERKAFGVIANGSYYAASSVNAMFQVLFKVLIDTNPFQFFKDIEMKSAAGSGVLTSINGEATTSTAASKDSMSQIGKYFSDIYNMFTKFAWAVMIPLSLIFLILAYFLTRNGKYTFGRNVKKFFIRIIFLAIGIPILGSAYTQVLDALKNSQAMSDEFITQAVSYTFLDFGEWVKQRRLAPVESMSIQTHRGAGSGSETPVDGTIPADTWLHLRKMCNNINVQDGIFKFDKKYLGVSSQTGALLKDFIYDTSETNPTLSITTTSYGAVDYDNRQSVSTLLGKYMNSETYSASTFESGTVAYLTANVPNYGDMLTLSCNKYSFSQNSDRFIEGVQAKDCTYYNKGVADSKKYAVVANERFKTKFADWDCNLWSNGTIQASPLAAAAYSGSPIFGSTFMSGGGNNTPDTGLPSGLNPKNPIGFSTMSMYTYLTSSFSQTGITVYGDAPSVYTQNEHYSVNLVGSNYIMRFAFFANMIAILLGYFILAVFFVLRTVFEVLFKGFELMAQSLLAALGFYKSIGRTVCLLVNMIAQLLVSVIFFSFMIDLMFIMTSVFDNVLSEIFKVLGITISNSLSAGNSYMAEVLTIAASLLSTLVIIFFISFSIRWRASLMATINGMIEHLVATLFGIDNLSGAASGVGGMAAGALNDTKNIAKLGAVGGAGIGAINGSQDMFGDISDSAQKQFGSGNIDATDDATGSIADIKTAADGSVTPTVGSDFDGGKGKLEGDAETNRKDAEDALLNGVGPAKDNDADISDSALADGSAGVMTVGGFLASQKVSDATNKTSDKSDADKEADDGTGLGSVALAGSGILARKGGAGGKFDSHASDDTDDDDKTSVGDKAKANADATTAKDEKDEKAGVGGKFDSQADNNAFDNKATDKANAVESSVSEDEKGALWSQTNPDTGTTTAARMDAERGLVLGIGGADGKTSDVALGTDGISMSSVDDNGNNHVVKVGKDGLESTHTAADGSTETVSVNKDGLNSGVTTTRTDAKGNSEATTTDLNGVTKSRTEVGADGSTRTLSTNESTGATTITEKNATTGYEATETIDSNGASSKTESLNGVSTVTNTAADGDIKSQTITKTDNNGNVATTGYTKNDDGSIVSTVSSGNVTTDTIKQADGSKSEIQSVMRDDGSVVKTTTDYGNDNQANKVATTVTAANGVTTLQTSETTSGSDDRGKYTKSVVSANDSTVETKDYGNGRVISTETLANGNTSVTQTNSDGSSVTRYADGNNQSIGTISRNADGTVDVSNPTNSSAMPTVTQSRNAAGSMVYTESNANGSSVQTVSDNSGNVTRVATASNGTETTVSMANGQIVSEGMRNIAGTQTVTSVNQSTGAQTVTTSDIAGNTSTITSQNGRVQRVEATSGINNTSFVQESGSDGSIITHQTLPSGSAVTKTMQANGDYVQETVNSNGSRSMVQNAGGNITRKDVSITGLETTAMSSGSATTETVNYSGMAATTMSNSQTGQSSRVFQTTAGQRFTVANDGDGSVKTIIETGDGNYGSVKNNADGSVINVVRNANGSGRVANIRNGLEQVVYTDRSGGVVSAPQGADTFNNVMAGAVSSTAGYVQNISVPTNSGNIGGHTTTVVNNSAPLNFSNSAASPVVNAPRKSSTSFLEGLFDGLVSSDNTTSQVIVNRDAPAPQRRTITAPTVSNINRSTSHGSMSDSSTRRGGSASKK